VENLKVDAELFRLRMQLRVAEARFWRDPDDPADDLRSPEETASLYQEVADLEAAIEAHVPVEGTSNCLAHDDPIFGSNNPPSTSMYLYHYTRVLTLPKIGRGALRFGAYSTMNDPWESLDVHPTEMGLISSGQSTISRRDPLMLTTGEKDRFESTDWTYEINNVRRQVKVGSFSADGDGDLRSLHTREHFRPHSVADRLQGMRGFAHPRMWAQYADNSHGICIVFRREALIAAFESQCQSGNLAYALGPVDYASPDYGMSLGFIDIGMLLEHGGRGVIIDNYESALLSKHEDWSHESEFRLLVIDEPSNAFMLPIGPECVAGVVVGPRFDVARHGRYVKAFARRFAIKGQVRKLDWTHGNCALSLVAL
jgi:Protein of unknown function (DUF2971)